MSTVDLLNTLIEFFFNRLVNFGYNWLNIITLPIYNYLSNYLPVYSELMNDTLHLCDIILQVCDFILNFSLIWKTTFLYLFASLMFRLVYMVQTWVVKIVAAWWHQLVP